MRHLQHERAAIDLASFRGISSNAIVKRYGLGSHGAYKHKANHLPTLRANEGVESAQVAEEHRPGGGLSNARPAHPRKQ